MLKFSSNLLCLPAKPLLSRISVVRVQVCGIKYFYPTEPKDRSDWPEEKNRKLQQVEKQPVYSSIKTPKMCKMIRLMRGPEPVHNQLIYKDYGVKALLGGRLKYEHFEAIRQVVNKKLDIQRMFAIWRVDSPWQPLSRKSSGKTLGGGKGSIHHYCTPVKANRIILELSGDIHKVEALKILTAVTEVLPFPARVISQKDMEQEVEKEKCIQQNNKNAFTMEYVIRNNMGGCHNYISKYDHEWFGKYK